MPSLALCVPGHNLGVFYTSKGTKTPLLMFLNIYYFQNKYNFQNIYFFKYVKCITLYLFIKLIKLFFSGTTRDWLTRGLCVSASQMVFMSFLPPPPSSLLYFSFSIFVMILKAPQNCNQGCFLTHLLALKS